MVDPIRATSQPSTTASAPGLKPEPIDQRLVTLCRLYDIEPQYKDVWGRTHDISTDTTRAILAAMGVELAGRSVDELIAERRSARWRAPLAPVQVLRRGEAARVPLRLIENNAGAPLTY